MVLWILGLGPSGEDRLIFTFVPPEKLEQLQGLDRWEERHQMTNHSYRQNHPGEETLCQANL